MKIIYIFLISTFIISSNKSYSQCDCAAQASGLTQLQIPEDVTKKDIIGKFKLSALYKNIFGDKYFTNNTQAPDGMIKYFKVNYTNFLLTYYLNDKITLFSDLGYFLNKEQEFRLGGKISGGGLSHVSVGGKYSIFENLDNGNELLFTLSGRIPLSQPDSTLPYHIQSSSGALGIHSNLSFFQSFLDRRLNFMISMSYDHNFENENNYQYGNNKSLDIMAFYKFTSSISASIGNRLEFRSNDKKKSAEVLSGGSFSTLVPGIHFRISDLLLSGLVEIPIYRNVNSNQMVTSYAILLNLSWYFNI
jgi:hypothetical protein